MLLGLILAFTLQKSPETLGPEGVVWIRNRNSWAQASQIIGNSPYVGMYRVRQFIAPVFRITQSTDYGINILNTIRANYGLSPVAYDPGATEASRINNNISLSRGLGHHFTSGYLQNSAGGGNPWSMWMASPAHRALILNPNLRSAGYSTNGSYSTLSGH